MTEIVEGAGGPTVPPELQAAFDRARGTEPTESVGPGPLAGEGALPHPAHLASDTAEANNQPTTAADAVASKAAPTRRRRTPSKRDGQEVPTEAGAPEETSKQKEQREERERQEAERTENARIEAEGRQRAERILTGASYAEFSLARQYIYVANRNGDNLSLSSKQGVPVRVDAMNTDTDVFEMPPNNSDRTNSVVEGMARYSQLPTLEIPSGELIVLYNEANGGFIVQGAGAIHQERGRSQASSFKLSLASEEQLNDFLGWLKESTGQALGFVSQQVAEQSGYVPVGNILKKSFSSSGEVEVIAEKVNDAKVAEMKKKEAEEKTAQAAAAQALPTRPAPTSRPVTPPVAQTQVASEPAPASTNEPELHQIVAQRASALTKNLFGRAAEAVNRKIGPSNPPQAQEPAVPLTDDERLIREMEQNPDDPMTGLRAFNILRGREVPPVPTARPISTETPVDRSPRGVAHTPYEQFRGILSDEQVDRLNDTRRRTDEEVSRIKAEVIAKVASTHPELLESLVKLIYPPEPRAQAGPSQEEARQLLAEQFTQMQEQLEGLAPRDPERQRMVEEVLEIVYQLGLKLDDPILQGTLDTFSRAESRFFEEELEKKQQSS